MQPSFILLIFSQGFQGYDKKGEKNVLKNGFWAEMCTKLCACGDGEGTRHVFPQLCGSDSDAGSENLDHHFCGCVECVCAFYDEY